MSLPEDSPENSFAAILDTLDLPRVPQQARSRQKRDALLVAAAQLFAERGYDATTADDIVAAAGVSIGTFYSYFRNKRQLFFVIYASCLASVDALRITEIDFSADPRQVIRAAVRQSLQRDELFYGIQRAWQELAPHDPELAAINERFNHTLHQQIVTAVRPLAARGLTWPDLDIEETCWTITRLLDQTWFSGYLDRDLSPEQLERRQHALADLIYHAILRPGSANSSTSAD